MGGGIGLFSTLIIYYSPNGVCSRRSFGYEITPVSPVLKTLGLYSSLYTIKKEAK